MLAPCAAALLLSAPAVAATGFFATPSGNIVCLYTGGRSVPEPILECGIKSGLKPRPSRSAPDCRVLDYVANRIQLGASGRAQPIACAGDAGPFANPAATPTLAYGTVWQSGAFRCSSETTGLTCRNRAGHGFFLSRALWHTV